jgi:hypothetical protein
MRVWIALGLSLVLGGCSLPSAEIRAKVRENALIFTAYERAWLPFARKAISLRPDLIRIDHAGQIVWRIERKREPGCLYGEASAFPLVYGEVPTCFAEVVPAQPLGAGKLYRIAAVGRDRTERGDGYFETGITARTANEGGSAPRNWGEVEDYYNVAMPAAGQENAVEPPDIENMTNAQ